MNVTRQSLLGIAAEQSAIDCGCSAKDFFRLENVFVPSRVTAGARVYLKQPLACNLVSYGQNVVACVRDDLLDGVREYLSAHSAVRAFETPALHELDRILSPYGVRSHDMAEYFLPDPARLHECACPYPTRLLSPEDFSALYLPEWGNALCADRAERDVLGVGAYDGKKLIALAGASADCEKMWQIGIDVLPEYRRKGIASALTSRLALEILARGKIPFYCAAWSNLKSIRNAISCGFYPVWVELTCLQTEKL